jgi:hypothetical protein
MLRPIGTTYQQDYPPMLSSADPHPHRFTWKVVGHDLCDSGRDNLVMAERIEAIKIEELPVPGLFFL